MKKFFQSLFGTPKKQTRITLELSDGGFYIVKAYGKWMTSTMTADKEVAEQNFRDVVEATKKQINHVIIKEIIIETQP